MNTELTQTIELYRQVKTERQGRKLAIKALHWNAKDARNYSGSWVAHFKNTAATLQMIEKTKYAKNLYKKY